MQLELALDRAGKLYEALTWTIEHRDCGDATKAQHRDHRRWLVEWFADRPVQDLNFALVSEYISSEVSRGIMKATIRKRLVTLRMALEDCYRRGLLPHTVDWWPDIESDSKPGQDLWTYEQYRQGRLAFDPGQRIGIDILFWTGMHDSDIRRWRRADVDLARGMWRRYNTKSKTEPAWLPLPDEFRRVLEEWFVAEGISSPAHKIAPLWWASPIKPMGRVCHRAGLPRVTQLGLRRSCVSHIFELAAAQGKEFETTAAFVAHWLGHKGDPKTSAIIRRHYFRWTPNSLKGASPF